jgi:alginate O-acetyltransferase complex protein AlgI
VIDADKIYDGIKYFSIGLGKKVLIANNIGALWNIIKAENFAAMPALTAWLGIVSFTLQIYFDFSGYSDMAVGLGKLLGFNFPQNFDYPYMSKSISEFWRRWHMTLGNWFKSYVYFPLGGSRKGTARTVINLAITWLLTGIWHGASWNFIVWGCFYGILIIAEKLFLGNVLNKIPAAAAHLFTLFFVIAGWVIFDTPTLGSAGKFFAAMFGGNGILYNSETLYDISNYGIVLAIAVLGCTNAVSRAARRFSEISPRLSHILEPMVLLGITVLSTAYLVDASYNPFLYFNF